MPFCFSFTAISVSRPEVARLTSSAASTVIRSKAFPCDPIDSSRPAPRSTAPSFDATVRSEPRRPPSPVVTDCITSPLAVSVTEASFSSVVSSPTVTAPVIAMPPVSEAMPTDSSAVTSVSPESVTSSEAAIDTVSSARITAESAVKPPVSSATFSAVTRKPSFNVRSASTSTRKSPCATE